MAPVTGPITADAVAERVARIRQRIADAGGAADAVTIVAVTKGQPDEAVHAAAAAGLVDFGENYAQELLGRTDVPDGIRWHFVGAVQRNKVRALAPVVHTWHTVDRPEVAASIGRHQPGGRVLVQVDFTGRPGRAGCRPDDVAIVVGACREAGLDVRGLMTVAPVGPRDVARSAFSALARLGRQHALPELSMGMSGDLEEAIGEGATILRIGTDLFGPRPQSTTARR